MERNPNCFYKEVEIRFCDCDRHKRARIETILRIMADVSGLAYTARGYTHTWLWERGNVFLITRAAIRTHRMPEADETILVETWEQRTKGIYCYRELRFYDAAGNCIVEGDTAWVIVDPQTRAIIRPADFVGEFQHHPELSVDTLPVARLKPEGEFFPAGEREIVYSDIDGNGHTYNAVYAGIACDVLPPAWIEERRLTDFRINFKQEALWGQSLTLERALSGDRAFVVGKLPDALSFEAEFWFAPVEKE
jgi:medium-chain acyl-[acyl-carrier-protein] hydrolase